MFVDAIEKVNNFTRPIHSILRNYGSTDVIPCTSTLFFVNNEGYAITCKHVIEGLIQPADAINNKYKDFKTELDLVPTSGNKRRSAIKALETKYEYTNEITVQVKNTFRDCVDKLTSITWHLHPQYDLAILKFDGFSSLLCDSFPVFLKDSSLIKQGKSLCRLGYPFPEFSNFQYNKETDDIEWLPIGNDVSPKFPIDGIITRLIANDGQIFGIEMSTPGLKGQSGGPLFDVEGNIYGMQFATSSLHLGFDVVNKEITVNNKKKHVSDYSFIHLGQCIHVDVIKDFLRSFNVKFDER